MTRDQFILFPQDLRADFNSNKDKWENITIDDYLDAMARYANDIQGYYDNTGQNVNVVTPD